MTKQTELAHLDNAILHLGPDSYLGPWLASVRAEVEALMRSDYAPMMLPSEALRNAQDIIAGARQVAGEITGKATKEAAATRDEAHRRAAYERGRVLRNLDEARAKLETI